MVKAKPLSRKGAVRAADKAFSRFILARDGKRCVLCGSDKHVGCGHLYSRVAYSTRWHPTNAAVQCRNCNFSHEQDWLPFLRYMRKRFGEDTIDDLYLVYKRPIKYKTYQIEEVARYFNAKAEELENGK